MNSSRSAAERSARGAPQRAAAVRRGSFARRRAAARATVPAGLERVEPARDVHVGVEPRAVRRLGGGAAGPGGRDEGGGGQGGRDEQEQATGHARRLAPAPVGDVARSWSPRACAARSPNTIPTLAQRLVVAPLAARADGGSAWPPLRSPASAPSLPAPGARPFRARPCQRSSGAQGVPRSSLSSAWLAVAAAAGPSQLSPPTRRPGGDVGWLLGPLHGVLAWPVGSVADLHRWLLVATAVATGGSILAWAGAPALGTRVVLGVSGAAQALLLLGPPQPLTDVFNYDLYGRMDALYGLNPYRVAAATRRWATRSTGSPTGTGCARPYGPLFTLAFAGLGHLPTAADLWTWKVVVGVSSVATVALTASMARRLGRDPARAAALLGPEPGAPAGGGRRGAPGRARAAVRRRRGVVPRARPRRGLLRPAGRRGGRARRPRRGDQAVAGDRRARRRARRDAASVGAGGRWPRRASSRGSPISRRSAARARSRNPGVARHPAVAAQPARAGGRSRRRRRSGARGRARDPRGRRRRRVGPGFLRRDRALPAMAVVLVAAVLALPWVMPWYLVWALPFLALARARIGVPRRASSSRCWLIVGGLPQETGGPALGRLRPDAPRHRAGESPASWRTCCDEGSPPASPATALVGVSNTVITLPRLHAAGPAGLAAPAASAAGFALGRRERLRAQPPLDVPRVRTARPLRRGRRRSAPPRARPVSPSRAGTACPGSPQSSWSCPRSRCSRTRWRDARLRRGR